MNRIAILSGKGGVGKSTVTVGLALALRDRGARVGVLDADLYGPNVPRMFGLSRTQDAPHVELTGKRRLRPYEKDGIELMSVQFLIGEGQAVAWASALTDALVDRLLALTAWGPLDYLLIDLPPGTADVQQKILRAAELTGAILVVTPQDVAHLDAKKVIEMLRRAEIPILGAVENMSGLECPHCGERVDVFPEVSPERAIWALDVERLLQIPLDPTMAAAADAGQPTAAHFADLAARVMRSS